MELSREASEVARRAGVDLKALVDNSAEAAFGLLPHRGRVQIHVKLDSLGAIPEVGVGGFTDGDGNVFLSIDDTPPGGVSKSLNTWLPALVAHELHHSSRIRMGPGYGQTLGEALVSEGLADRFAQEVFPATPTAPWSNAFPKVREAALWRLARRELFVGRGTYDHVGWFFGGGSEVPRWTGYTLGWRIAGAYLDEDKKPSQAVEVTARTVIAAYERASSG